MKLKTTIEPDWIFETSWEVCNRVGGIYTVLSTKAETLRDMYDDHLVFIGPDVWTEATPSPFFKETKTPINGWLSKATKEGLGVRIGRWDIPGEPICVLVNHRPFMEEERLNQIYGKAWDLYGVDSLHGYGDYAESTAFAVASGMVMVSLREWLEKKQKGGKYIAHFNEWMLGMGELVVKQLAPDMATVFTTHATSIGRSIAGNGKPLYGQLPNYNGDQMASELNMQSKHSIEKIAAHEADCFTTVSEVTDKECAQLLEKPADIVTPNGFEDSFVPSTAADFKRKRTAARKRLSDVVECLTGVRPSDNALFLGTCGRCEFKNKGIDLFIDSLNTLSHRDLQRDIIGFIMVPGWEAGPRADLQGALEHLQSPRTAAETELPKAGLPNNMITHHLHQSDSDSILRSIRWFGFQNKPKDKVKIIYVPCYLNGDDGIFNMNYYDVLIGLDLTAFPSYYEPWGYTPLESVAFSIPTITTTLSGFGQWVNSTCGGKESGVLVIPRDDNNYWEVRDTMADCFSRFASFSDERVAELRKCAKATSQRALWKKFIAFYVKTYTFALKNASKRNQH
ncbi:MAG: glycogen/starch synthase [Paludibacteraceae bacterium]|nr:glycogen/starch synthase [Paludibacteraceae bacterium]